MPNLAFYDELRQQALKDIFNPANEGFDESFDQLVQFARDQKSLENQDHVLELLKIFAELYKCSNIMQACAQSFAQFFVLSFKLRSPMDIDHQKQFLRNRYQKMVVEHLHIYDDPSSELFRLLKEKIYDNPDAARILSDYFFLPREKNFLVLSTLTMIRGVFFSASSTYLEEVASGDARQFSKAHILSDLTYSFLDVLKNYVIDKQLLKQRDLKSLDRAFAEEVETAEVDAYVDRNKLLLRLALHEVDLGHFVNSNLARMNSEGEYVCEEMKTPEFKTKDSSKHPVPWTWDVVKKQNSRIRSISSLFLRGILCVSKSKEMLRIDCFTQHASVAYANAVSPMLNRIGSRRSAGSPRAVGSPRRRRTRKASLLSPRNLFTKPEASRGRSLRRSSAPVLPSASILSSPKRVDSPRRDSFVYQQAQHPAANGVKPKPIPAVEPSPWPKRLFVAAVVITVVVSFCVPYFAVALGIAKAAVSLATCIASVSATSGAWLLGGSIYKCCQHRQEQQCRKASFSTPHRKAVSPASGWNSSSTRSLVSAESTPQKSPDSRRRSSAASSVTAVPDDPGEEKPNSLAAPAPAQRRGLRRARHPSPVNTDCVRRGYISSDDDNDSDDEKFVRRIGDEFEGMFDDMTLADPASRAPLSPASRGPALFGTG